MAETRILGLEDLTAVLRTLSPKLQKKGIKIAARKAMHIVRDAARSAAKNLDDPETAAKIHKNIVTQFDSKSSKKYDAIVYKVGVKGGAASNQASIDKSSLSGGNTVHWRWVEFGTSDTPAVPFMRPALSNNIQAVTDKFVSELTQEIARAL